MGGTWSDDAWDDDGAEFEIDESQLDALDFSTPTPTPVPETAPVEQVIEDDCQKTLLVTVTNPPGTVSVTASLDGRPVKVDLAPQVVDMTEAHLAEEIALIAELAKQNARAGQHLLIAGMLTRLGHDRVSTRGYLEYELGLPPVDKVLAEKARIFASRYADDGA